IYHSIMPTNSVATAAPNLLWSVILGGIAGNWSWVARQPNTFAIASFCGGVMFLVPFTLVTYGMALVALPGVAVWALGVRVGVRLGSSSA
ncbi:MAG TPA: hypothetical protein VNT33_03970, partial [Telluria sp.]|nr:hypothetical protein [Telluria sp.]